MYCYFVTSYHTYYICCLKSAYNTKFSVILYTYTVGLHEKLALSLQGNTYKMVSPIFEMTLYMGLGLVCGLISVAFNKLRDFFTELYAGETWGKTLPFTSIPPNLRPVVGGVICGLVGVFFPQTLFYGYSTLDSLLVGKFHLDTPLTLELLVIKMSLTAFCLASGLIGGIFAPSLFFGATAGAAYHDFIVSILDNIYHFPRDFDTYMFTLFGIYTHIGLNLTEFINSFVSNRAFDVANSAAYATVGAAAVLGALFRAPLTSSMLMFEITQNHDIVLPVLVSTGLAGLFAELINQPRNLE